ncbi:Hypothetical_protein [Hexamita inflata]|uniref:Hypothetical_protein n=1 Tax=Hexamita inflata TaxID=28002 RepID=A0AA86QK92_9EUKA|nr:Hypothetical protein HINF_LOCUS42294 [Hexamita inflata]
MSNIGIQVIFMLLYDWQICFNTKQNFGVFLFRTLLVFFSSSPLTSFWFVSDGLKPRSDPKLFPPWSKFDYQSEISILLFGQGFQQFGSGFGMGSSFFTRGAFKEDQSVAGSRF